jgi:hypothetical protein
VRCKIPPYNYNRLLSGIQDSALVLLVQWTRLSAELMADLCKAKEQFVSHAGERCRLTPAFAFLSLAGAITVRGSRSLFFLSKIKTKRSSLNKLSK